MPKFKNSNATFWVIFKQCAIFSREEYISYEYEGNWLGNCTDPKSLYEDIIVRPHEFLFWITITTFDGEVIEPSIEDDSFWKETAFTYDELDYTSSMVDLCYALVIPERLQNKGIRSISAQTEVINLKISPPGYLYQNRDIKQHLIDYDTWLDITMDYQINNFIKIGDEDCIPDPLFNRDDCFFKQLICVSTQKYTVFENHRKSLIQHCEQSELHFNFEVN